MNDLPKDPMDLVLSFIPDDPERALKELLPEIAFAEVMPVASPTAAQLKAIHEFEPYTQAGLSEIKRQLIDGQVRFGPQHQTMLKSFYLPKLERAGMQVRIRPATHEELKAAKLVDEKISPYFQDPPPSPPK
jgi:hypothetical protein